MSRTSRIHRGQPRLCLLTTLLFLLCIYIKRVNSSAPAAADTCNQHQADSNPLLLHNNPLSLQHKLVLNKETFFDLECPVGRAIEYKSAKRTRKAKSLYDQLVNSTQVCGWNKDGAVLHRPNGNPILYTNETDQRTIVLPVVGISDSGEYECKLLFNNVTQETLKYFNLYSSVKFNLIVDDTNLPDTLPTISHPPADQYVQLGEDATFTCRKIVTLLSPITMWFKSTCSSGNETCTKTFLEAFNKTEQTHDSLHLANYIVAEKNSDEFRVQNVSQADVGYYGCLASNGKGLDIRLGSLRLFESKLNEFTTTSYIEVNRAHSSKLSTATPMSRFQAGAGEPGGLGRRNGADGRAIDMNESDPQNLYQLQGLRGAPSTEQKLETNPTIMLAALGACLLCCSISAYVIYSHHQSTKNDKKNHNLLGHAPIVGQNCMEPHPEKQHLPTNGHCPDIFGLGKTTDGFISGHLLQKSGHLMTQSICSGILDDKEKNPSISSNNSNNSDEASSWGKSTKSDLSRNLYRHTSNDTTTTVPMYDHPPSAATATNSNNGYLSGVMVHDTCVINPIYGFVRPEDDSTDWIFPRRNLERLNKIGEGQFGEVWRYIARQKDGNENYVAVKQLKTRVGLGDRERLELIAEIEIMKSVNKHPNVIKLLNYCVDEHEPLLLIMEYAENGKLQTYLRNCRSTFRNPYGCLENTGGVPADGAGSYDVIPVTSKELIKFSYHIAKGMEYVASKGIIHRDLASRNILLSKDKVCKVADFGFARRITDECAYERTTASPVPVKWMAPEALVENKFTSKSDVFSLGILMWEIVTLGATPYENLSSPDVYKKVTNGGRLDRPLHCKDEFYQIMSSCWLQNPADRPTFKEIANNLEKLLLSDNDYIQLDQYPEHAYYNISYK